MSLVYWQNDLATAPTTFDIAVAKYCVLQSHAFTKVCNQLSESLSRIQQDERVRSDDVDLFLQVLDTSCRKSDLILKAMNGLADHELSITIIEAAKQIYTSDQLVRPALMNRSDFQRVLVAVNDLRLSLESLIKKLKQLLGCVEIEATEAYGSQWYEGYQQELLKSIQRMN